MAVHNCKYCKAECGFGGEDRQRDCKGYIPMTNADKIRAMTDKELLEFLVKHDVEQTRMRLESNGIVPTATQLSVLRNTLQSVWGNWLRQPAEES